MNVIMNKYTNILYTAHIGYKYTISIINCILTPIPNTQIHILQTRYPQNEISFHYRQNKME